MKKLKSILNVIITPILTFSLSGSVMTHFPFTFVTVLVLAGSACSARGSFGRGGGGGGDDFAGGGDDFAGVDEVFGAIGGRGGG